MPPLVQSCGCSRLRKAETLSGKTLVFQGTATTQVKQSPAWETCSSNQARKHFFPATHEGRGGENQVKLRMKHHLPCGFAGCHQISQPRNGDLLFVNTQGCLVKSKGCGLRVKHSHSRESIQSVAVDRKLVSHGSQPGWR